MIPKVVIPFGIVLCSVTLFFVWLVLFFLFVALQSSFESTKNEDQGTKK
jgi:hypothetical protein